MDNETVGRTLSATNVTFKLELIQEDLITAKGTTTTYLIKKDGRYVDNSVCFDEGEARMLYDQLKLNNGELKRRTIILSEEIEKGGQNG